MLQDRRLGRGGRGPVFRRPSRWASAKRPRTIDHALVRNVASFWSLANWCTSTRLPAGVEARQVIRPQVATAPASYTEDSYEPWTARAAEADAEFRKMQEQQGQDMMKAARGGR